MHRKDAMFNRFAHLVWSLNILIVGYKIAAHHMYGFSFWVNVVCAVIGFFIVSDWAGEAE